MSIVGFTNVGAGTLALTSILFYSAVSDDAALWMSCKNPECWTLNLLLFRDICIFNVKYKFDFMI